MYKTETRQAAEMYALVADMESIKATIEGMKADNMQRSGRDEAMTWGESDFQYASDELMKIAKRLRAES